MIINQLLSYLMEVVDSIGIIILAFGVFRAAIRYVQLVMHMSAAISIESIRLNLGQTIILAVEFLLVSDLLKTIISPNYYEIGMLGALVVIRTILTYFLNKELEQIGYHIAKN